MFDLFTEILFVTGFVHLVVLTESRFSALRPEPDIQERDNYQPEINNKILPLIFRKT
jgi:hypothetical protein